MDPSTTFNFENFITELGLDHDLPPQAAGWLASFHNALLGGISAFERHITCGGFDVEDPKCCDCGDEMANDIGLVWFHRNHRLYNRAQKRLIAVTVGLIVFREMLVRDLAVEDSDLGPKWGRLLPKDYARAVLAHFIDGNDWC